MIRLTFMTGARRVIGASTPEGNARRFALLPPALLQVMPDHSANPNGMF